MCKFINNNKIKNNKKILINKNHNKHKNYHQILLQIMLYNNKI